MNFFLKILKNYAFSFYFLKYDRVPHENRRVHPGKLATPPDKVRRGSRNSVFFFAVVHSLRSHGRVKKTKPDRYATHNSDDGGGRKKAVSCESYNRNNNRDDDVTTTQTFFLIEPDPGYASFNEPFGFTEISCTRLRDNATCRLTLKITIGNRTATRTDHESRWPPCPVVAGSARPPGFASSKIIVKIPIFPSI